MEKNTVEIEKYCRYCENATSLSHTEKMLCSKRGVVSSFFKCASFRYDPLKRAPAMKAALKKPEFDKNEMTELLDGL